MQSIWKEPTTSMGYLLLAQKPKIELKDMDFFYTDDGREDAAARAVASRDRTLC